MAPNSGFNFSNLFSQNRGQQPSPPSPQPPQQNQEQNQQPPSQSNRNQIPEPAPLNSASIARELNEQLHSTVPGQSTE